MADPVRLRDVRSSATKELRELLAAGRSEIPGAERLHGVARRLGYPASAVPNTAKLLAKAGAGGGTFAGAAKIGALVVLLGAGAAALAMRERTTLPAPHVVVPVTTTAAKPTPQPTTPTDVAPTQERAPPSLPPSTPNSVARPGAAGHSGIAATPVPVGSASAQGTPAPSTALVGLGAPSTWGSSTPLKPDAPEETSAPAPLRPIEEAQRELASNPSHALSLALRDQRISGDLVEDRELVIVRALLRLGRTDEAREHAARFLRLFPASTHREEVAAPFGFDPGAQNP